MSYIVIEGAKPYDGRYDFSLDVLTAREWGWIKRLAGYVPAKLDDEDAWSDPELVCVLAAIMLRRAGRVEPREVPAVFEKLVDGPFDTLIRLEMGESEEEDDAGPPARSSGSSEPSPGANGKTSSETSPPSPPPTGTPAWASLASPPETPSET